MRCGVDHGSSYLLFHFEDDSIAGLSVFAGLHVSRYG